MAQENLGYIPNHPAYNSFTGCLAAVKTSDKHTHKHTQPNNDKLMRKILMYSQDWNFLKVIVFPGTNHGIEVI